MNKFRKFSALILITSLALAADSPVPAAPPSASLAGKADSITLPVEILGGHVFVQTRINGVDGRFVLDSGAGIVVLTTEFARKLGLLKGETAGTATGVGGSVAFESVTLATLETGGARLENVQAAAVTMPQGLQADGILGLNYFRAFVVTIDYENVRLTLTKPRAFQPTGPSLPLTITETPAVEAVLDGHRARLEIDTGDGDGVTLNRPFVEHEKLRENYTPRYELSTGRGVGGRAYGTVARAKMLTLGPFNLPGPIVEFSRQKTGVEAGKSDDGRIGNAVLSRFVVTFDYARKKLYLTPNARLATPFVYNRSGLSFDMNENRTTIVSVIPGSPGEQAGVKIGDEVLAVNDVIVANLPIGELKTRMTAGPGTSVKLTLRQNPDAKPFMVTLVLRDLL